MGTDDDTYERHTYAPFKLPPDEVAAKLKELLMSGVSMILQAGIAYERVTTLGNSSDPEVRWAAIDGTPVFRVVVVPDMTDEGDPIMASYGSWLPAMEKFAAEVVDRGDLTGEPDDEPEPEPKTDPDFTLN